VVWNNTVNMTVDFYLYHLHTTVQTIPVFSSCREVEVFEHHSPTTLHTHQFCNSRDSETLPCVFRRLGVVISSKGTFGIETATLKWYPPFHPLFLGHHYGNVVVCLESPRLEDTWNILLASLRLLSGYANKEALAKGFHHRGLGSEKRWRFVLFVDIFCSTWAGEIAFLVYPWWVWYRISIFHLFLIYLSTGVSFYGQAWVRRRKSVGFFFFSAEMMVMVMSVESSRCLCFFF